jgi:hypothetical protein
MASRLRRMGMMGHGCRWVWHMLRVGGGDKQSLLKMDHFPRVSWLVRCPWVRPCERRRQPHATMKGVDTSGRREREKRMFHLNVDRGPCLQSFVNTTPSHQRYCDRHKTADRSHHRCLHPSRAIWSSQHKTEATHQSNWPSCLALA